MQNTPVLGGRIAAEYDSLSNKITHLYAMREMVLPEDKLQIYDESLDSRPDDTKQQTKKSQHEKSEGASKRQQQTHMETLHSKQTSQN